jgi:hypothetical protein
MPVLDRHMDQSTASLAFAKRLDHFQVLNPLIDACTAFYTALGFRISDAIIVDGTLEACFLWRKGSVSDLVLMEGNGPRLHHAAFLVRQPSDILRACDRVGELGFAPITTVVTVWTGPIISIFAIPTATGLSCLMGITKPSTPSWSQSNIRQKSQPPLGVAQH